MLRWAFSIIPPDRSLAQTILALPTTAHVHREDAIRQAEAEWHELRPGTKKPVWEIMPLSPDFTSAEMGDGTVLVIYPIRVEETQTWDEEVRQRLSRFYGQKEVRTA